VEYALTIVLVAIIIQEFEIRAINKKIASMEAQYILDALKRYKPHASGVDEIKE